MADRTELASKYAPHFLDVLDELLAVLLPLVPVLGHHQLSAVAGLRRRRRRLRLVVVLLLPFVSLSSSAPSGCITTVFLVCAKELTLSRTRINRRRRPIYQVYNDAKIQSCSIYIPAG
jgi:hypothetical protein